MTKNTKQQGFTLIEIMVVVVIIGILAAFIVPKVIGRPEQARDVKARQDIMALENALELYRLDNGYYPSNEQGLVSLVTKPSTEPVPKSWKSGGYLKHLPNDPWGNPYQYRNPGTHGEIDIYTFGPQGSQTSDASNWLGNWNVQN
jgi:general secretion pathway protein G